MRDSLAGTVRAVVKIRFCFGGEDSGGLFEFFKDCANADWVEPTRKIAYNQLLDMKRRRIEAISFWIPSFIGSPTRGGKGGGGRTKVGSPVWSRGVGRSILTVFFSKLCTDPLSPSRPALT